MSLPSPSVSGVFRQFSLLVLNLWAGSVPTAAVPKLSPLCRSHFHIFCLSRCLGALSVGEKKAHKKHISVEAGLWFCQGGSRDFPWLIPLRMGLVLWSWDGMGLFLWQLPKLILRLKSKCCMSGREEMGQTSTEELLSSWTPPANLLGFKTPGLTGNEAQDAPWSREEGASL